MEQHVKVLGILNIVAGGIGALGGIIILIIFGGAYGIVGAVSNYESEAAVALPVIAIVGLAIAVLVLIISAPAIIAGIGLLQMRPWSKIVGIVVSALHIFNVPFGTALGIYGLYVLCSQQSQSCFEDSQ